MRNLKTYINMLGINKQTYVTCRMPAKVRNVIKSVKKVTDNITGSNSWSGTRTDNFKTWLFSEAEIFDTKTWSVGNEGSKYARFTSNSLRIKN